MSIEWMPLLIAAVTLVGAAGTYAYQKWVDRRSELVELRRIAYRNYLSSFMDMSDSPEHIEEIRRRYYQAEVELLIIGSDKVVQKVGALSRFYTETNDDRLNRDAAKVRRLVAETCQAMRADCFEESALTIEEVQALVPIV